MEKRRRQQRRRVATVAVALVVALVGSLVAFAAFTGGGRDPAAARSPAADPSPTPSVAPGTPTGTVRPEPGPEEVACGAAAPKGARKPKPQFAEPAQVLEEGVSHVATIRTSCGEIVVELLSEQAPETVNSFVFLARSGFFDATRIHRIDTSIDVLQAGDPTGTGTGGPGYSIDDELTGEERYDPGVLAMANAGPNTAGSQFFIIAGEGGRNLDANPAFTIFGRVVEGLDVAKEIARLPIQDPDGGIPGQQPAQAVYLEEVTISKET